MKRPSGSESGKPARSRLVPSDWMRRGHSDALLQRPSPSQAHATESRARRREGEPRKWLTTLRAPLAEVRDAAMAALTDMNASLAYLYEADGRIVVRSTLPNRQIRAEMTAVESGATRVVVVTMNGDAVDRGTSGRVIEATEAKLERKGFG